MPVARIDRTCRIEEERLEGRVVPHVKKAAGEPERRPGGSVLDDAEHPDAEPDQDDADVLDAVVGEEALQVVLSERQDHAEHAGDDTEQEQRETQPFRKRRQQGQDPNEPIDPHLQDDTRQEGRDVAGRCGMCPGEPDVEWDDSGLDSEPEKGEEQNRRQERRAAEGARSHQQPRSRRRPEKSEHREQSERRGVRGDDDRSIPHAAPRASSCSVVTRKKAASADHFPPDEKTSRRPRRPSRGAARRSRCRRSSAAFVRCPGVRRPASSPRRRSIRAPIRETPASERTR